MKKDKETKNIMNKCNGNCDICRDKNPETNRCRYDEMAEEFELKQRFERGFY